MGEGKDKKWLFLVIFIWLKMREKDRTVKSSGLDDRFRSVVHRELTDAGAFPARELALLYLRHWSIELWWRHIKTSMGMETLCCLTPPMAHKELWMYLIAYNMFRCLTVKAGALHDRPIERLSFKGAADAARQFSPLVAQARAGKHRRALIRKLLAVLIPCGCRSVAAS